MARCANHLLPLCYDGQIKAADGMGSPVLEWGKESNGYRVKRREQERVEFEWEKKGRGLE